MPNVYIHNAISLCRFGATSRCIYQRYVLAHIHVLAHRHTHTHIGTTHTHTHAINVIKIIIIITINMLTRRMPNSTAQPGLLRPQRVSHICSFAGTHARHGDACIYIRQLITRRARVQCLTQHAGDSNVFANARGCKKVKSVGQTSVCVCVPASRECIYFIAIILFLVHLYRVCVRTECSARRAQRVRAHKRCNVHTHTQLRVSQLSSKLTSTTSTTTTAQQTAMALSCT